MDEELLRKLGQTMQAWHRAEQALDERYGRKRHYAVREAAEFWGVHELTVRRWIRAGKVEATNPGERQTGIPRKEMIGKKLEQQSK